MIKTLLVSGLAAGTGFLGWIGGSIWPAPPEWTDTINRSANDLRAQLRLQNISFDGLRQLMPGQKFEELKTQLNQYAAAAGEVIMVEHDNGTLEEQLDNLALDAGTAQGTAPAAAPAPPPAAGAPLKPATPTLPAAAVPPAPATPQAFAAKLELCPRMAVSNAPVNAAGVVSGYHSLIDVKGVRLAAFPTKDACMSSGFGPRSDRLHKGVDYHAEVGVPILAAGDGAVIEMKYRDDYGNMVLIDHGGGVYTRYAHMASFGKGLMAGVTLKAGDQIGLMGNTAGYQIPMHLHYEVLVGDYRNAKGSFGLEPVDPMIFPAAK